MLYNVYRNRLDTIKRWFEITSAIFNPARLPVKIRVKELDAYQQYDAQRKLHALKRRR